MIRTNLVIVGLAVAVFGGASYSLAQNARKLPGNLGVGVEKQQLSSNSFQLAIMSDKNLGRLTTETNFIDGQAISFGFGDRSPQARIFILGSLYSQALAYWNGGDADQCVDKLRLIEQEFISLRAPSSMYGYVTRIRNIVETGRYQRAVVSEFLGMFEPFLEDYANSFGEDAGVLLFAGSWLVNYRLAAAAGDRSMLHQANLIRFFKQEMERLDAPGSVVSSLEELAKIADQEKIKTEDLADVQQLVEKIQNLLQV